MKRLKWLIPLLVILTLAAACLIYTGDYYRADADALAALGSDAGVSITQTAYGWFFDGPSTEDALIFYPGAKVEESAYAPLLHCLAEQGMDVCLVKMPFHLAFFDMDKAMDLTAQYDYDRWYIGGHSLGGAMAAGCAADHGEEFDGVILLAAYPTEPLAEHLALISIYGSEDGVLNLSKVEEGRQYVPGQYAEYIIDGGNHAQFGNYGRQKGDGDATISAVEQQDLTAAFILKNR